MPPPLKPLFWIASAKKDLQAMPDDVQDTFGYALYLAQVGRKHGAGQAAQGLWFRGRAGSGR